MDEVSRLKKKIIENMESTIVFLNELLDGQSRKIEKLENNVLNVVLPKISKFII